MTDGPQGGEGATVWSRLRRRKVVQWGIAYAAGAWGLLQGLQFLVAAFEWPSRLLQLGTVAAALGLPIVLVLAWYHGERGEQRVARVELAVVTMLFLLGGGLFWRYHGASDAGASDATTAPAPAGTSAAAVPSKRSIAVLPFVNMSADPGQEYFADGISEELLNLLAKVTELRVIARTSSFAFKGKDVGIAEIARQLNVTHVLQGSVRRAGDTLRITVQLIRTSDSAQLWSNTYERQMTDVFKLQDEIARSVVDQLTFELTDTAPRTQLVARNAYALYLQARHLYLQGDPAAVEQSIALYKQALAIEPNYSAAWEGLSKNFARQADFGLRPRDEGFGLAREAAVRALSIDPNLAEAHADLGWIARAHDRNLVDAARHYTRALALAPTDPGVLRGAAGIAYALGRVDQSIYLLEQSIERDPVNSHSHFHLGISYLAAARIDEAIQSLRTALTLSPSRPRVRFELGNALLLKGDSDAAFDAMQQEPRQFERLCGLVMAFHARGQLAKSDAVLHELIDKHAQESAYTIAYVLAFRGEADRAFQWLDKAVESRDTRLVNILGNPYLTALRNDSRWSPLMRKIGMAPEQIEAIEFDAKVPE